MPSTAVRRTESSEGMQATKDVLDSPAVAVLCGLEDAGLDLAVVDGRLRVWPVTRLTAGDEQLIQQHRDALVTLIRLCDAGVRERLATFQQQRREAAAGTMPAFVFVRGTAYVKAVCFSCGTALPLPEFGRCWRCSLAWRMAAGVPIPAERAAVYDRVRLLA